MIPVSCQTLSRVGPSHWGQSSARAMEGVRKKTSTSDVVSASRRFSCIGHRGLLLVTRSMPGILHKVDAVSIHHCLLTGAR